MADMPSSVADLTQIWGDRATYYGQDHEDMDEIVNVYFGGLPDDFKDYFHEDMHIHIPNMIRLSWDDLTAMSGKVFPIYVKSDNNSSTAKKRAEHLEQIGYGYNEEGAHAGGIGMRLLMGVLSWWMVGCANAVGMVLPGFKRKAPYFTFRDPRTFFPPVGWSPYTQAAPRDALFAYMMTIGELTARYEDQAPAIRTQLQRFRSGAQYTSRHRDESEAVWVGEYYHEDAWMIATLTDNPVLLTISESGDRDHPGVQPVVPMGMYSPLGAKGRSLYADQVSIQAALARMFSQKLDFYDRTLYPLIFHTPIAGGAPKMGPLATNEYLMTTGVTPRADQIAPAHPIDADQTMSFVLGLSRMLNRNPEQLQGAGDADSAKALAELKTGITATIRDQIWPPIIAGLPRMYQKAAEIDLNLWKYRRRIVTGRRKNSAFQVPYTPAVHLLGNEEKFGVEPGLGLAGYQGTLEILQLTGAERISEDTALEQLEDVTEPQEEKRRLFNDRLQKVMFATLAAKAQMGAVAPGALAELRRRTNEGEDPYEVMEEMEKAGSFTPPALPPGVGGGPEAPGGPEAGGQPAPDLQTIRRLAVAGR